VAEAEGQAHRIEPGQVAEPWIVARPVSDIGTVGSVGSDGRVRP